MSLQLNCACVRLVLFLYYCINYTSIENSVISAPFVTDALLQRRRHFNQSKFLQKIMNNQNERSRVCRRLNFDNEPKENENETENRQRALYQGILDNTYNQLMESQDIEEQKRNWNFDFENEVPLEGKWEWERIETRNLEQEQNHTQSNENVQNEANEN